MADSLLTGFAQPDLSFITATADDIATGKISVNNKGQKLIGTLNSVSLAVGKTDDTGYVSGYQQCYGSSDVLLLEKTCSTPIKGWEHHKNNDSSVRSGGSIYYFPDLGLKLQSGNFYMSNSSSTFSNNSKIPVTLTGLGGNNPNGGGGGENLSFSGYFKLSNDHKTIQLYAIPLGSSPTYKGDDGYTYYYLVYKQRISIIL